MSLIGQTTITLLTMLWLLLVVVLVVYAGAFAAAVFGLPWVVALQALESKVNPDAYTDDTDEEE
ncbi:hypothetical protein [Nocardiopsis sp. NRRL B-16309]|uniref:hypothetical protein n=1 Tax=Nocardiopsis sp. NRRL B-16309 TaxID=1519494 RepID=UPI0006AF5E77|nr:hypothetical protein [Nocardiopsis sp. NRRL B-16309]KOX11844.1 hypothetical protein ADL05_23075 [Nocardiopsis sp. NRRL B-16309]